MTNLTAVRCPLASDRPPGSPPPPFPVQVGTVNENARQSSRTSQREQTRFAAPARVAGPHSMNVGDA